MLNAWQDWFHRHVYLALFFAAFLEGLGLPVPAEVLFVATAGLIHGGTARLDHVIIAAVAGNLAGALFGFGMAFVGGQQLLSRVAAVVRVKPEALAKVESFFDRYGAATVFLSRFVGPIRAATIYVAGAARMAPWRFTAYMLAAVTVWNTAWAWLAYRFGARLPGLVHEALGQWAFTAVGVLAAAAVLALLLRRRPVR